MQNQRATMDKRRGGCAPNIAYTLALLGERPYLMATAGQDFGDYGTWLTAAGVTCSSAAAFLKLLWRAAATKARNALTDGRREFTSVAAVRPSFSNARSITSRLLQRSRRNSMCSR